MKTTSSIDSRVYKTVTAGNRATVEKSWCREEESESAHGSDIKAVGLDGNRQSYGSS